MYDTELVPVSKDVADPASGAEKVASDDAKPDDEVKVTVSTPVPAQGTFTPVSGDPTTPGGIFSIGTKVEVNLHDETTGITEWAEATVEEILEGGKYYRLTAMLVIGEQINVPKVPADSMRPV